MDCWLGVLQRASAGPTHTPAVCQRCCSTHLHGDRISDLGDLLITHWVTTFALDPPPLPIIGSPDTAETVEAKLKASGHDIEYQITHHTYLNTPPLIEVYEYTKGFVGAPPDGVSIRGSTNHGPVTPTIGFRIESGPTSVVLTGGTVPCASLDELAAEADALVHTIIRKNIVIRVHQQADQGHLQPPLVNRASDSNRGARGHRHPGHNVLCP
nr:B1937_C1_163 [Mycobacterium leprae]